MSNFYKKYKRGTYSKLSYEERKFYIDKIQEIEDIYNMDDFTEEFFEIEDNLKEFVEDMISHFKNVLGEAMKYNCTYLDYSGRYTYSLYDEIYGEDISLEEISGGNLYFNINYDQYAEYVTIKHIYDMISDIYLNKLLKYHMGVKMKTKYLY